MAEANVVPDSIEIKIDDEELKGRYANLLRITHSREEFVLDFIHLVPPQGIVVARVVTSPSHMKRLVNAVAANLARYEESFGPVPTWDPPASGVH
jgi:hypothetical protein